MEAFMLSSRKALFAPGGRQSRRSFWLTTLIAWLVFAVAQLGISDLLGRDATIVLYPFMLGLLFVCCARRYHDLDKAAWWLLLLLIPVVGQLWCAIELTLRRGSQGENRYGSDPREPGGDYMVVAT